MIARRSLRPGRRPVATAPILLLVLLSVPTLGEASATKWISLSSPLFLDRDLSDLESYPTFCLGNPAELEFSTTGLNRILIVPHATPASGWFVAGSDGSIRVGGAGPRLLGLRCGASAAATQLRSSARAASLERSLRGEASDDEYEVQLGGMWGEPASGGADVVARVRWHDHRTREWYREGSGERYIEERWSREPELSLASLLSRPLGTGMARVELALGRSSIEVRNTTRPVIDANPMRVTVEESEQAGLTIGWISANSTQGRFLAGVDGVVGRRSSFPRRSGAVGPSTDTRQARASWFCGVEYPVRSWFAFRVGAAQFLERVSYSRRFDGRTDASRSRRLGSVNPTFGCGVEHGRLVADLHCNNETLFDDVVASFSLSYRL